MRLGPALLLAFLLVPLFEIYLLLEVGGIIGVGWTIFAVVFTAVLGAALVRMQGFATVNRIRAQLDQGQLPAMEMFEGVFLLVAGALLLTPGFFTDAVGFACLTPPFRRAVIRYLIERGTIAAHGPGPGGGTGPSKPGPGQPLEGDYRRMDD
ncbi:MAG TPA: FxsA family protein [Arenicellales bacterium]|nr:FxsA family protein [Arenicellales bacterium]